MSRGRTIAIIAGIFLIIVFLAVASSPVPDEVLLEDEERTFFRENDPLGDVLACAQDLGPADQSIALASNSVDIVNVEMSTQGNDLVGMIEVTGPIPNTFAESGQEDSKAASMFIDVDGDRAVDYVISFGTGPDLSEDFYIADLVNNQKYMHFPGKFHLTTNKFEFQIPIEIIGGSREFNWYVSTTWQLVMGPFKMGESIVELSDIFPDPEPTVLGPCIDLFTSNEYNNWARIP